MIVFLSMGKPFGDKRICCFTLSHSSLPVLQIVPKLTSLKQHLLSHVYHLAGQGSGGAQLPASGTGSLTRLELTRQPP